jgi:hypothetical protein
MIPDRNRFCQLVPQPITKPDIKETEPCNDRTKREPHTVLHRVHIVDGKRYKGKVQGDGPAFGKERNVYIPFNLEGTFAAIIKEQLIF